MSMLRFEMSGQRFEFDAAKKVTAAEFFLIDEILGRRADDFLEAIADGLTGERGISSVIKEFCVMAFLAQRRTGGRTSWDAFAETIEPETFVLLPADPPPAPPVALAAPVAPAQPGAAAAPTSLADLGLDVNAFQQQT